MAQPQATAQKPEHATEGQGFRRRFPRREFAEPLGLLVRGTYILVEAVEIGEGGLLISSSHTLEVGQRVVLNFFIPRKSFVSTAAEVLYLDKTEHAGGRLHFGFKFISLDFESQRMIRDYIAEKSNS